MVLVGGEHGNTSGVRKHGIKVKEVALNGWLTGGSKDGSGEGCGGGVDVPVVLRLVAAQASRHHGALLLWSWRWRAT